jgi:hypothetical protein
VLDESPSNTEAAKTSHTLSVHEVFPRSDTGVCCWPPLPLTKYCPAKRLHNIIQTDIVHDFRGVLHHILGQRVIEGAKIGRRTFAELGETDSVECCNRGMIPPSPIGTAILDVFVGIVAAVFQTPPTKSSVALGARHGKAGCPVVEGNAAMVQGRGQTSSMQGTNPQSKPIAYQRGQWFRITSSSKCILCCSKTKVRASRAASFSIAFFSSLFTRTPTFLSSW